MVCEFIRLKPQERLIAAVAFQVALKGLLHESFSVDMDDFEGIILRCVGCRRLAYAFIAFEK